MQYIRKTARYNGKKYQAYGKTELEAMTKLAEKLAAAKRGEETVGGNMTVDAWFKQWMDTYKRPKGLTAKSLAMYESKYTLFIGPRIGHMKLRDVKDIHLQRILNGQAGRSFSQVSKLRLLMREMFHRAYLSRLIPYDPAEALELPEVEEGTHRSITAEERAAILAVGTSHPAGLWVLTLLFTGMRPGETAALTWSDVDFENNEIHVHAAVESGTHSIKAPKTAAGIRDIPIHSALRPLLLAARREPFRPVFPSSRGGGRLSVNALGARWKSFRRELARHMGHDAADDLTPYCLRHTFCTDLQRAGVPINVAKELMGHSDIQVTADIYTHKDAATLHAGMRLLDGSGVTGGVTSKLNLA